ncbi:hypothetical protein OSTOST_20660 [Ostertagia ostertagi]
MTTLNMIFQKAYVCCDPMRASPAIGRHQFDGFLTISLTPAVRFFSVVVMETPNNFPVRQMCMEYCARPELSCPSGAAFHRHPNGELLECQSNAQCPSDHECLKPMFQAVGEGRYCCPTRRHICEQQPDKGDDCGQSVMRQACADAS